MARPALPPAPRAAAPPPGTAPRHARTIHGRDERRWWHRALGTLVVLE
ncbi:hypothetical protein ACFY4C_41525 [Actinomadura viridis]